MAVTLNSVSRRAFSYLFISLGSVCCSFLSTNLGAEEQTPTELAVALIDDGSVEQGRKALEQLAETNDTSALIALFEFHTGGFFSPMNHDVGKKYLEQAVEAGDQIARWRWATTAWLNEDAINTQMLKKLFDEGFNVAACHLDASDVRRSEDERDRLCSEARYALALSGDDRAIYDLWIADDPRYFDLMTKFASLRLKTVHLSLDWDSRPTEQNLRFLISALRAGGLYSAVLIAFQVEGASEDVARKQGSLIDALDPDDQDLIRSTLLDVATGEKKGWFDNHYGSGLLGAIFREGHKELKIPRDWGIAYQLYGRCGKALTAGLCENWQGALINSGGPGLAVDQELAFKHFLEAHDLGYGIATANVAQSYTLAEGVELDFKKAHQYFELALERDQTNAAYQLANLYFDGLGVDQDLLKAADLYRMAAIQAYDGLGNPMAMIKLAKLHEQALLPDSDLSVALSWYQKAAVRNVLYERLIVGESDEVTYRALANAGMKRVTQRLSELSKVATDLSFGRYNVLLVANERYEGLTDLKTPQDDALLIGSIFEAKYGAKVEYLINSSRSDLLSKLSQYRREMGPEDNFILYFAGHGVYDDELEVGYWQLSDAIAGEDYSWVETDRVSRTLSAFKSRNAMIIADSCYSGSVVRGNSAVGDVSNLAAIKALNAKKSRVAITSGGLQPVLDAAGSSENSSFAKNFAAALENVRGPTPASVLFNDLRTAVSAETAAWGFEQVPEFAPLYRAGHDGGDFILSPVSK